MKIFTQFVLLASCLSSTMQIGHAQTFKAGDYVDLKSGAAWLPCTVRTIENTHYQVSCAAIDYFANPTDLRARAVTAADQQMAAETAAAMSRLPRPGNGPGVRFGTRDPKTCDSRTAPAKGPPSADQARQYVICELEVAFTPSLFLVTNVKVQVAATPRPANQAFGVETLEPVWDIRGSLTRYSCIPAFMPTAQGAGGGNPYARTHNCSAADWAAATGICYKNTFGDWHCAISQALGTNIRPNVLPPEGN